MLPTIPPEFKKIGLNFGPDLGELVSSWDDLVNLALNGIDRSDAAIIKPYLDELLSGKYATDDLKQLWWSMPVTTVFHDGTDVIVLLSKIREAISRPPYFE